MKVVFSEEEIQDFLKTLSSESREILFSKNVFLKLNELIEKYEIPSNQKKLFIKIVGLIVLGKINKKELYPILELNLDIEENDAKIIANEAFKILELGELEARNKKLRELKEKKEESIKEEEKKEEVFFEKPIINKNVSRDSYREIIE